MAVGDFDVAEFADFIDKCSLECVPENVAIYYSETSINSDDLKEAKKHVKARLHCALACYSFNSLGRFGPNEKRVESFLRRGSAEIIRRRNPVVLPPPGRSFVKPSGARESYFIQAANLFVRHAEMSFFALLLIREWGDLLNESVKTVYVDTIDLYGLVSVACRMRFNSDSHGPITVSYSSYSGYLEVLKHADVSKSLMVISATTSHGLLRKILQKTRWKAIDRIVTILDLDPAFCDSERLGDDPKVIAHVTPEGLQPHHKLLPSIRLSGEKFTIEADAPKSVVLNAGAHIRCLKQLKLPILQKMVSCFSGYAKQGNERLPICVDSDALLKDEGFRSWLKGEIESHAPASTSHVVCMGDFEDQLDTLLEVFGERRPLPISPERLRDPELKITGSTIVICPTFTTGTKLLEVSRDLRKHGKHKSIVYFTGVGTPVSLEEFQKLKRNLEHEIYRVRSFCNVCTGQSESLRLSWQSEQELLRDDGGLGAVPELKDRARALENGGLGDCDLFYRVSDLELHPGFKLWESVVDPYPSEHPSVLLFATIAFLLQNARTDSSLPEKDRLSPLSNRRVVLDPENFFRYNDSLIQIALLRAAFPSELDYSDHSEHSASIHYLIQRAIQVWQRSLVYEFLLALASRRLQITPKELDKVRELVGSSDMDECRWFDRIEVFKK